MAKPILQFRNATKVYCSGASAKLRALEDVSFSLNRAEFLSVIGPSGCGKSTLLRLAAGLETISTGNVLFCGTAIDGPDRKRGFVFQSYNVFPWLTVEENVAFGLEVDERDSNGNDARIAQWLDFTGLTDFARAYPKSLSGGMRQRLALARTIIVEPELLLLDEPFGALDEHTRAAMQTLLLRAVQRTQCTVVFVTHDIREAIFLSDRVLLLSARPGRILRDYRVNEPQPRTRGFLRSDQFIKLYEEILDEFPA